MRFPIRRNRHCRTLAMAVVGAMLLGRQVVRAQGTLADYERGAALAARSPGLVLGVPGAANWIGETDHFWYTRSVKGGTEFVLVDAGAATKKLAFDHEKAGSHHLLGQRHQVHGAVSAVRTSRGGTRRRRGPRQIWFQAGGMNPDQDPYFTHNYTSCRKRALCLG